MTQNFVLTGTALLHSLIAESYTEESADAEKAAALLLGKLRKRPKLLKEIIDDLMIRHCRTLIGEHRRTERSAAWQAPVQLSTRARGAAGIRALGASARREMMDSFPLQDGTILGDATREQVQASADAFGKQAASLSFKERFLRSVAGALQPGQKVRAGLKEKDLQRFKEAATT